MASSRYFMCTDFHHLFENNVENVQGVTLMTHMTLSYWFTLLFVMMEKMFQTPISPCDGIKKPSKGGIKI